MRLAALVALYVLSSATVLAEETTTTVGFKAFRERRRQELAEELRKWKAEALGLANSDVALTQLEKEENVRRKLAITTHLRQLSDPDPEVRQTSAQILGQMDATAAVPNLIALLNDRNVYVQIYAHGALNRLTGKNFGYKNHREWKEWWDAGAKGLAHRYRHTYGYPRRTLNTVGLIALDSGDPVRAARMFLGMIYENPDVADYWNNFGLALMELGMESRVFHTIAMECFLETIEIDSSLPQPYLNIGQCFMRLGRNDRAHHWFSMSIERDKQGVLWEQCWKLGNDSLKAADFQQALEYLGAARRKAESNGRQDPRIYRDLARAYVALGDDAKALDALKARHKAIQP